MDVNLCIWQPVFEGKRYSLGYIGTPPTPTRSLSNDPFTLARKIKPLWCTYILLFTCCASCCYLNFIQKHVMSRLIMCTARVRWAFSVSTTRIGHGKLIQIRAHEREYINLNYNFTFRWFFFFFKGKPPAWHTRANTHARTAMGEADGLGIKADSNTRITHEFPSELGGKTVCGLLVGQWSRHLYAIISVGRIDISRINKNATN